LKHNDVFEVTNVEKKSIKNFLFQKTAIPIKKNPFDFLRNIFFFLIPFEYKQLSVYQNIHYM